MPMQVAATYENGVLKLLEAVPLHDRQRVVVTIEPEECQTLESRGLVRWPRDLEVLRAFIGEPATATPL
jgi:predicted DNA-binding antitoxin AbrB/MazE fold protein